MRPAHAAPHGSGEPKKEARCIQARFSLPILLAVVAWPAPSDARNTGCQSKACHQRVQAAHLAKNHGGCRSHACVRRVRLKAVARQIRKITPYRCSFGRSAIPCRIVLCESGGSWNAYNRSGAAGRYQLMAMHGRPWPANTQARRLQHHRIAARLWNHGAGARNWVCA